MNKAEYTFYKFAQNNRRRMRERLPAYTPSPTFKPFKFAPPQTQQTQINASPTTPYNRTNVITKLKENPNSSNELFNYKLYDAREYPDFKTNWNMPHESISPNWKWKVSNPNLPLNERSIPEKIMRSVGKGAHKFMGFGMMYGTAEQAGETVGHISDAITGNKEAVKPVGNAILSGLNTASAGMFGTVQDHLAKGRNHLNNGNYLGAGWEAIKGGSIGLAGLAEFAYNAGQQGTQSLLDLTHDVGHSALGALGIVKKPEKQQSFGESYLENAGNLKPVDQKTKDALKQLGDKSTNDFWKPLDQATQRAKYNESEFSADKIVQPTLPPFKPKYNFDQPKKDTSTVSAESLIDSIRPHNIANYRPYVDFASDGITPTGVQSTGNKERDQKLMDYYNSRDTTQKTSINYYLNKKK